jgi:hypothetical protein
LSSKVYNQKGFYMPARCIIVLFLITLLGAVTSAAGDNSSSGLTEQHRIELIRTFNSDLVYIRTRFPMGKTGLTIQDGKLSPSGEQLDRLLALWGPSVKPGDRAMITQFLIRNDRIHLEINGGPVKKTKWYQHIQVGAGGGMMTPGGGGSADPINNPRGSYVDVVFDHHVPDLTVEQLKQMLLPVFDFDSKSPLQAYLETVPPKVKQAIENHQVLVGMNREMVIYAKGRPEKKIREKDNETEYEDWIYGNPPQDVDFVRVVGDQVVRVETMKVNGEKLVRTEKEVDLAGPTVATAAQKEERPANAPTLRRPGEELPNAHPSGSSSSGPAPIPDIPQPPSPQPQ